MSAKHGMSKEDKSFIRQLNQKVFKSGMGEKIQRQDMKNPSVRKTLTEVGTNLSTQQKNQVINAASTK